jgi:MoaA/NifB/PqqE/SkfB family radical SAM enzyme
MDADQTGQAGLPTYCCIAILESCFLRCRMCYKWKEDIRFRHPQEPSLSQWKKFISSLKVLAKKRLQINFAGGEPLARKEEILELIKYASVKGFDTLLATNAVLIDEDTAKRIADSGLTVANISLDSLQAKIHDYLRGVEGVYEKVIKAIDLLDKYAPDVRIGICTTITQYNLGELTDIVRWIQSNDKIDGMGFQAVTQPFSTPEDAFWYKNKEFSHLWPADIIKVDESMDELIALKQNGFSKLGNPISQFHVYKAYFHDPNRFIKKQACHIDTQAVNITPTGEIRVCFYMNPIGNIKTDDINDVWFSQRMWELRKAISLCKRNCQSMVNCNFDESQVYTY